MHDAEREDLLRDCLRLAEECDRLAKIHTNERSRVTNSSAADRLKVQHSAEVQALEQQHASEAKLLAQRHQRELAVAKPKGQANTPKTVDNAKEKDHQP